MNTLLSLVLALSFFPRMAPLPRQGPSLPASPATQQAPEVQTSPVPAPAPAVPLLITPFTPPPETYLIGKQDLLKITVFEDDTLNGSFRVDADGMIQMNLINRITAAGLTLRAFQERVRASLADGQFIKNPTVRVEIEQYKSQYVTVMGEVRTPQKVPMMGTKSLLEALTDAGSMNSSAGSEVTVTHVSGEQTVIDMKDVLAANSYMLHDGDIVAVPKNETFTIQGQVRNTGILLWQRNMTLAQAVALAGGLNEKGKYGGAEAVRVMNGKPVTVKLREQDPVLPNDSITIAKRIF
jgi:polysaccharide export outer membrane protein